MGEIIIKASQFLLSLSLLIVLHEGGHFFFAKLFKTKVEKFYLFFDPWFSLFKFKKGDTEYGIGWIPLGGYVKISGMIDESMDMEQMKEEPKPWEFRSKPSWQRLLIMLGGIIVNVIVAMAIYSMTLFVWGEKFLPNDSLVDGVWVTDTIAMDLGFQNGDKIISVNDKKIVKFSDIPLEMLYGGTVHVDRGGERIQIEIPNDFIGSLIDKKARTSLFSPRLPFVVGKVQESSAAFDAGLMEKDKIVEINTVPIKYFDQLKTALNENKGTDITLIIERDGQQQELYASVPDNGTLGFVPNKYSLSDMEKMGILKMEAIEYGIVSAVPAGIKKAMNKLDEYVKQFMLILSPSTRAYEGMGGFMTMGSIFPSVWDWNIFWEITAFLSIILAFMNLLPIPALDGGHVVFLLYEMIFRRKPNEKFLEYAQITGIVLLISLMVYANGNDINRFFF